MVKHNLKGWLNRKVFSPKEFYVEVLGDGTIWIVVDGKVIAEGQIKFKPTSRFTHL